jgi:protein LTV1
MLHPSDKKNASHFTLVHRPQNDPLIHDTSVSSMVLNPTSLPNSNKVKKLDDLVSELGSDIGNVRNNEGEAANHGVYFDDTEYDYMQHMRDLGSGSGEAYFVESQTPKTKEKQTLEDALKNVSLEGRAEFAVLDEEILPSKNLHRVTYQAQQNIPDVLAGFKPDMDPRLREVLEALEDDAYVDDDEEVFCQLTKDKEEVDDEVFEQEIWGEEQDGWESEDTAKPVSEYKDDSVPSIGEASGEREDHEDKDWLVDFEKFKKDQKSKTATIAPSNSDLLSSILSNTTNGGRRKKRKGALTSRSGYSMTSSSLLRTEGLTDLDSRFERFQKQYTGDIDDVESVSAISSTSSVRGPVRGDFDSIMDDFIGNYSVKGKNLRKGKYQSGLEQLDELRKGLGPARIRT